MKIIFKISGDSRALSGPPLFSRREGIGKCIRRLDTAVDIVRGLTEIVDVIVYSFFYRLLFYLMIVRLSYY